MKRFIPYILILLLSVSCIPDESRFSYNYVPSLEPRYIYLANTEMTIDSEAGSFDTYVEAESTPWKFSGHDSWLTVSPLRGTDNAKVTIAATENMSGEDLRTCLFWLSSDVADYDYQAMVSVTQQAAWPYLNVSESSLTIATAGGSKSVTVERNISYTISQSSSATWVTVTASADSTKLTITAEPNPTAETRTANITLSGRRTQVIRLTQEAAGMVSDEYGPIKVGMEGGNYALQITSDAAWTASTTNGSWFTVTPGEGAAGTTEVVLSVSPNNTTSERSGKVDFRIGSTGIFSVRVDQEGLYCTVSPTSLSMGAVADSRTLKVSSNTAWTVISKPSWITTDIASGSGDGTVTITASEHTGSEARSGEIKIGVEGVTDLVRSVYVIQSQHYLNLTPSSIASLPSTGGTHKVSVASDDTWEAGEEEAWLSLSPADGVGDIDVTLTAADNPSIKERSGKVFFTPRYASPIELSVKQAGRYLSVNTTRVEFTWRGGECEPIEVTTDGTFSVTTRCEWLEIAQSGHSFTLIAEEYDGEEPRSAVVTVALIGLVAGEVYSIDIPVVQRPNMPIDITAFPDDMNWNIGGNSHASVTITGYAADESWDNPGGSSLGLNITVFGKDEDWNH